MCTLVALLLLAGVPFWEAKPPQEWTDEEVEEILTASHWAKTVGQETSIGNVPGVHVYLASAKPMQEAEQEVERRMLRRKPETPGEDEEDEDEYRLFVQENQGKYIILAVRLPDPNALDDAEASRRMEEESYLKVGRKKHKMIGHFPPTPLDPYLRLIFPRAVRPGDKRFLLELYLPSAPLPYRTVEFFVEDLVYKGKPEM
jgi:hypothetical protein